MSEDIETEYPIFRIWLDKGTSLEELKYKWTYADILKANALLDMRRDYDVALSMVDKQE